ncbi:hypothetical protein WICMUC_002518 [Wickerhamomyces mucosus]|uniref:Trehalose-phosphatase n=1 Tax=Wickerhamomyces mucosus TaxID=1378264 RepID=A0A9P8TES9_9ASCO|nr:hypothetical protein WICMUC_002518 [Wickerhamomyces mucosus]
MSSFKYPKIENFVKPSDYKDKKLSGRILNAFTNIPYQIYKNDSNEEEWSIKHLPGNSALLSSFSYLEKESEWENHLFAWTGELEIYNRNLQKSELGQNQNQSQFDESFYLNSEDKEDIESKIKKAHESENIHPIWLLRKDQQRWRRYAENCIWPAFHYIMSTPSDGREETQWWYDYVKFNEAYASKVIAAYKPGDIIWVHDYYLLLLPQLIRMQFPNAIIAFFMHCPFPSSEYFRALPKRQQLLDGLLGSNKVSFQNPSFARHFLSSCKRILGFELTGPSQILAYGLTINVDSNPIGIDVPKIEYDTFNKEIDSKVFDLKLAYSNNNKKIIVGRDRLDSVRGVVQKLQAFETFLEMYPEMRDKVILIQVSSPSFSHSAKIEQQVSELISNINGKYGSLNSIPIHHYQMRIAKEEYFALLRVADLGLITSVRDGMNTTAFEYVIAQKYNHSPLILSEFSGNADVLHDALIVNPWDSVAVAKAIYESLNLDESRKQIMEKLLYKSVPSIQQWTNDYLTNLIEEIEIDDGKRKLTSVLDRPLLLDHYKQAHRRLFLFDYDGTLTPIVKDPAAAIPSSRLINILGKLSEDPKNLIWIISGRDQAFLEKWLGSINPKLGLSAEHGCFMKDVNNQEWVNLASEVDMSWQQKVEDIYNEYNIKTPGASTEKKKVALTWHYRRSDPELGEFNAEKLVQELQEKIAPHYDVEVMTGKANVEVRPSFVNKGEIVRRLVCAKHGSPQVHNQSTNKENDFEELPDFIVCLGDDSTDEDMFNKLNDVEKDWESKAYSKHEKFENFGIYPIKVGTASQVTNAKFHLNNPTQVLETLGLLVGDVSIFETGGSKLELDDRGHLKDSLASKKSRDIIASLRRHKSEIKK